MGWEGEGGGQEGSEGRPGVRDLLRDMHFYFRLVPRGRSDCVYSLFSFHYLAQLGIAFTSNVSSPVSLPDHVTSCRQQRTWPHLERPREARAFTFVFFLSWLMRRICSVFLASYFTYIFREGMSSVYFGRRALS